MKSRMEKYYEASEELKRTKKNEKLYNDIYHDEVPTSKVSLQDIEIEISEKGNLIESREAFQRAKKYQYLINKEYEDQDYDEEEDLETKYDIYEDIENKVYDINSILEMAKNNRGTVDKNEARRKLKNTQYNILSNLDLSKRIDKEEVFDDEEMDSDFFTKDNKISDLMDSLSEKIEKNSNEETSVDLFNNLKSTDDTILTKPITEEDIDVDKIEEKKKEEVFYTGALSFSRDDFDSFQDLQSTVQFNNKLIKILIWLLVIVILVIIGYVGIMFL